ncbi:putative reverse transcriptase domain-containing protein [Tanacetum coccineum]
MELVFEKSKCAEEDKVKFDAYSLKQHEDYDDNIILPSNQNSKNGVGTLYFDSEGDDIEVYNNRFHELALICPDLVTPEKKKIERYIQGLPKKIKANVTSSKPTNLHDAINMACELAEPAIQGKAARIGKSNKRKRQEAARAYAATPFEGRGYAGNLPGCNHCNSYHNGQCPPKFQRCEKRHYKNKYPKKLNHHNQGARGQAYVIRTENPQQNPNVVTGTFLLNDHYASILFDSGAEKSFVSTAFTPFIDIACAALDTSNEVELADGKVVSTNIVLRGFTLALFNHYFKINILSTRLGSFDVITGMDWLSYHRAVIVCYEKIVRV